MYHNYFKTELRFERRVEWMGSVNNFFFSNIGNKTAREFSSTQIEKLRKSYEDELRPSSGQLVDILLWANKLYGDYNNLDEKRILFGYYLTVYVYIENLRKLEKILGVEPYIFSNQKQVFEFLEIEGLVEK